jgi:hypothetical protein
VRLEKLCQSSDRCRLLKCPVVFPYNFSIIRAKEGRQKILQVRAPLKIAPTLALLYD